MSRNHRHEDSDWDETPLTRIRPWFWVMVLGIAACTGILVLSVGGSNPRTDPGFEGYIYNDPFFLGKREFLGTQVGPVSRGLTWRDKVINIDMRPRTYSEDYEILTKGDLNVSFQSHARIRLKRDTVAVVVDEYGADEWYAKNVKEQYRSVVRQTVRAYDPFEIKVNTGQIEMDVLEALRGLYKDSPIVFETMSIGNLDYPKLVQEEIEAKKAALQKEERVAIEARVRVAEAQGLADAQKIINDTLTPLYVQYQAIDTYKTLAGSENTTFVIMPTSASGAGMPMILNAPGGK